MSKPQEKEKVFSDGIYQDREKVKNAEWALLPAGIMTVGYCLLGLFIILDAQPYETFGREVGIILIGSPAAFAVWSLIPILFIIVAFISIYLKTRSMKRADGVDFSKGEQFTASVVRGNRYDLVRLSEVGYPCPKCGAGVTSDMKYCPQCSHPLSSEDAEE